jgi:hypothetical protein
MNSQITTTIKNLDINKKTQIFNVIKTNKEKYTVNRNGIFIDYLKLTENSKKQIKDIVES